MPRFRHSRFVWLGAFLAGLVCACSLFSSGSIPSSSSSNNLPTSGSTPSTGSDNFPLTPNPVNVQITLDKAHAVSDKGSVQAGVARGDFLSGKTANNITFNFDGQGDYLTQDADGTLAPAFGTAVTVTPVSAIAGIPFSKGFVSAFQFGPEGLLMTQPATFEMTIPGEYSDLVGFASNSDGTDFHLYPVDASSGGGTTTVTFNVMHFSMYGVAEATQSEITAQQAHPPSSPVAQEEDDLATPKMTKKETGLSKEHDRLVKPKIQKLDNLEGTCNDVFNAVFTFNTWYGHVKSANDQNLFGDKAAADTKVLMERLKDCLPKECPVCKPGGKDPKKDKKTVDQYMISIHDLVDLNTTLDNTAAANFYRMLETQCAENSGRPVPTEFMDKCTGSNCGPTPTPLPCPLKLPQ